VVTDITYIRTWHRWLYLAVVLDLFSHKIVGWSACPTIHRELVLNAVLMAVRRRQPRGTVIHSDQGSQYGSDAWRRFCRSNHFEPSMGRKGNCWDDAVAESFFSSLSKERIKKQIDKNRELGVSRRGRLYRYLLPSNAPPQSSRRVSVPSNSRRFTNRGARVSTEFGNSMSIGAHRDPQIKQIKSSGNPDVRIMGWQVGLGAPAKRFSSMFPIVSGTGWQ
jgi:transposase InsO family protein